MSKSWEWRVFFPAAQVPGTRLEKYLESVLSAENNSTLKAPRTDTYVVVNNENLVQGGDGIGVKHRGVLGNMELKVRLSKACDRRLKGLEQWEKTVVGNISVSDVLRTSGLWTGSRGEGVSEADVVEGTVSITKERRKIKSILLRAALIIDKIDAAVVTVQGTPKPCIANGATDRPFSQRWMSISIEGSKLKSTSKAILESGLLEVLEDFSNSIGKTIIFGGYPTFVETFLYKKDGSNHGDKVCNARKVNDFLASESKSKKIAITQAAALAFEHGFKLNGVFTQKVSSDVPEQPVGNEETFKGALNRVKNFTTVLEKDTMYQDLLLALNTTLSLVLRGSCKFTTCVEGNFSYYDVAWIVIRDLARENGICSFVRRHVPKQVCTGINRDK